jgi:hypothetical protein
MPRPDVSSWTLDSLARHLLALPDGVDCMQLSLFCDGRPVRVFVARGVSADVLAQALDSLRDELGRADFDR